MRALVVGGAASGKSAVAERLATGLSRRRVYVATMRADGEEARRRIARHRAARAGLAFETLECPDTLDRVAGGPGVALVEDVGNLVSNALFDERGRMADEHEVLRRLEGELMALSERREHVVVVGHEVGCEGACATDEVLSWVRLVGRLQRALAARFDLVLEVVAGVGVPIKGGLPCQ